MVSGINHIPIAVSNIKRSRHFYKKTLGFTGHVKRDNGTYLSVGELWLCLACGEPYQTSDYTPIAFDIQVSQFEEDCSRAIAFAAEIQKKDRSEGQSLYILDLDGHKL